MTNSTAPNGTFPRVSPPSTTRVEDWLASAHPSPSTVHGEWSSKAGLALIPLGRLFDAVRLSEDLVRSVAGISDPPTVNDWLGWSFNSRPVIHDPSGSRYYALVPPGTAENWLAPAAACLGEGTYLGVPRADLTQLREPAPASYWAVPMPRPGRLCRVSDVLTLVMAGRGPADSDGDLT